MRSLEKTVLVALGGDEVLEALPGLLDQVGVVGVLEQPVEVDPDSADRGEVRVEDMDLVLLQEKGEVAEDCLWGGREGVEVVVETERFELRQVES